MHEWWKRAVIYQIYPRSFADSDGDGIGDLKGIEGRLDYLVSLGIDTIWLSPIYPSPMADFGYDVSDYTDVHPLFGSLADMDALIAAAHERGLRVLLDLVPNHSSDEHPWFEASRSSREDPKRDWYMWRDAKADGSEPNNWESLFGGTAWEWDEHTGQYYLHLFDRKQADLNWRNPEVREAIYDAMRFWLERGIDGFRIDVLWLLIKDEAFADNPPRTDRDRVIGSYDQPGYEDLPETHEIVREMRAVADEFDGDRVLIGEIYLPLERLMTYYGADGDGIHMPFNFGLVVLPEFTAEAVRDYVEAYEAALPEGGWPNWVLGNHDTSRIATRAGDELARAAQMLLLTLRGTPTVYYGDELGMRDVPIPAELVVDPQASESRDPERTPMRWTAGEAGAGFTTGDPWLPIGPDLEQINVAAQEADERSMLAFTRRLTEVRRQRPELAIGTSRMLACAAGDLVAFVREHEGQRVLVAINLGASRGEFDVSEAGEATELLCATGMDPDGPSPRLAQLSLDAGEGLLIALAA